MTHAVNIWKLSAKV